jgi:hypothetical protein
MAVMKDWTVLVARPRQDPATEKMRADEGQIQSMDRAGAGLQVWG